MATAKVFKSGNSQAVRLPKKFRFKGREVEIFRRGNEVILREKSSPWFVPLRYWRISRMICSRTEGKIVLLNNMKALNEFDFSSSSALAFISLVKESAAILVWEDVVQQRLCSQVLLPAETGL